MKTICSLSLHCIILFAATIGIISWIGCEAIDDILSDIGEPSDGESIIADMPIQGIEVLLMESDPVQVTVEVNGWLPDSCTVHHETHQAREGNSITIQITTIRPKDLACAAVITAIKYQEKVFIGALPAGDYTVTVNNVEQQFHID